MMLSTMALVMIMMMMMMIWGEHEHRVAHPPGSQVQYVATASGQHHSKMNDACIAELKRNVGGRNIGKVLKCQYTVPENAS